MKRALDSIVIGAGQSGPFLAERLARAGQRVALIERRGLGGTCVNDGCIPTNFEIVAANLLDGDSRKVSDRLPIYGLYIDPPLGRVGMTEAEARQSGRKVLVGKRPMTKVGRATERGETHGFIKVMVDADTKEILGAAILGIEGDEVVHSIADVMYARAPYTVISRAVHAHPTVSELVPTTLQSLQPLI